MEHNQQSLRLISIFFVFCFCYLVIIANLFRLQVVQFQFFEQLAQEQYQTVITIPSTRAPIFDRSGKQFLALNKECISAFIVPGSCKEIEKVKAFLKKHFPLAAERLEQYHSPAFMYIKRRLTPEEQSLIEIAHLPDIQLVREESRYYPVAAAGTILGLTDIDNKGLFGIELQYDALLAGKPTTVILEKDARSGLSYFKKSTAIEGKLGKPITLTIDGTLQFLAREELLETLQAYSSHEGAVLIMDPLTGDLITMVSLPDFDPNATHELDMAATKNRILTERYELGSVIKVCAALAAFEEGVVEADEIIDCKGTKTAWIDGRKINTVHAHGAIPFWEVIAQSNNIGTAIVAKRVGTKLYDHYLRMGFGEKAGTGFPGEQQGFVNHPDNWSKQSIISLSYGYEVSITLLHLAQFFAMIANNGIMVPPRLILDSPGYQKQADCMPRFSAKSIETMQMILEKTTLQGTARRAAIKGYRIMSKTGTANTIVNGHYTEDENLFTTVGIIEKDDYKRVIVVFVRAPGAAHRYAASVAVPLFERITEKVLIHDKII